MYYVYRIQSVSFTERFYIGFTADLRKRIEAHNAGKNTSTAPFRPWRLMFYAAFDEEQRARDFELYLKTGSGHAFANKRLW